MRKYSFLVLGCLLATASLRSAQAATTIDPTNRFAWGANIGWVNFVGNTNDGAVIGEYVCSGYIYAANVGWIHLGDGTPANGIHYENDTGADHGVWVSPTGQLLGLAWGANIGWVNFDIPTNPFPAIAPRFDLETGKLSGYAWGANVGWISLSNAVACVRTDRIAPGADSDSDGIADAWELGAFGNLTTLSRNGDRDGDGATDFEEYIADTDPFDPSSRFASTIEFTGPSRDSIKVTGCFSNRDLFRVLRIWERDDLSPGSQWSVTGDFSNLTGGDISAVFGVGPSPLRVFRLEVLRPSDILGMPMP